MKNLKSKVAAALMVAALTLPFVASAQGTTNPPPFTNALAQTQVVGNQAGIASSTPLPVLIGNIVNVVLGFLGIVFLVLLLYAGFLWMTAQGEEKPVTKAKDIIKQSIIGLIVIVAAFAISNFVLTSLIRVSGG